jgi:RimJ/RimL family protein N-acetyltransferase
MPAHSPDTLQTERLVIRRFTPGDWQDLYEYLSDPEVVRYEPYDVYTEEQCRQEAIRRSSDKAFWAVCLAESGRLIGNLYLSAGQFGAWELGYVFNPRYQGQGYATESARAIVAHAFEMLGARRIVAMCNPDNHRSWRLLERLGMRREGHLRQNVYFKRRPNGSPIWLDTYEYALLASEWRAQG